VRQLASRAREHIRDARPRFSVAPADAQKLIAAFNIATATSDFGALSALLTEDAVMVTDSGGKRRAALRVLVGREDVIRLFKGLQWRHGLPPMERFDLVRINGAPGMVIYLDDGPETLALEAGADGRICAIYAMRNPDKLTHIAEGRLGG
jgi:RNA polymerase sigma-70 factor (ECF subfamily)